MVISGSAAHKAVVTETVTSIDRFGVARLSVVTRKRRRQVRPALFLDIDGVLLPETQEQRTSATPFAFPQRCLDALEHLLYETNAEVILSSTWRNSESLQKRIIEQFSERGGPALNIFARDCREGMFSLTTELGVHKPRQQEIAAWLRSGVPAAEELRANGNQWVALDDEELVVGPSNAALADWFRPRFVKVNEKLGLTLELANQAIESLSSSQASQFDWCGDGELHEKAKEIG